MYNSRSPSPKSQASTYVFERLSKPKNSESLETSPKHTNYLRKNTGTPKSFNSPSVKLQKQFNSSINNEELQMLHQRNQERIAQLNSLQRNIFIDLPNTSHSSHKETREYKRQLRDIELQLFTEKLASQTKQATLSSKLEFADRTKEKAAERAAEKARNETLEQLLQLHNIHGYVNSRAKEAVRLYKAQKIRNEERKNLETAKSRLNELLTSL